MEHVIAKRAWEEGLESVLEPDNHKRDEYNRIPVAWCNTCKSLKVINCEVSHNKDITCYCGNCYSTDITEGNIEEWENVIKNRKNFL